MIRYLKYELKKNFWTLVVLTAIAVIVYVVTVSTSKLFSTGTYGIFNQDPQISLIYTILGIFCAVVPVLMYSFKMNKRSVDAFYSLPIKKEKMYLVKTLMGLLLVLIPYTIAYWLGFLTIALRENYFHLIYYIPGYFGGLLFGVCLYGLYAFAFTRANRVVDGVVFMLAYTFIGFLIVAGGGELYYSLSGHRSDLALSHFFSFGGLMAFETNIATLIQEGTIKTNVGAPSASWMPTSDVIWEPTIFLYPILLAAASYALMFLLLRREKAENAEQNSDSWFGYRVMIPLYIVAFFTCISYSLDMLPLYICVIAIGAVIMTIVYTRKILFNWRYWVMIAASVAVGLVLHITFL